MLQQLLAFLRRQDRARRAFLGRLRQARQRVIEPSGVFIVKGAMRAKVQMAHDHAEGLAARRFQLEFALRARGGLNAQIAAEQSHLRIRDGVALPI